MAQKGRQSKAAVRLHSGSSATATPGQVHADIAQLQSLIVELLTAGQSNLNGKLSAGLEQLTSAPGARRRGRNWMPEVVNQIFCHFSLVSAPCLMKERTDERTRALILEGTNQSFCHVVHTRHLSILSAVWTVAGELPEIKMSS